MVCLIVHGAVAIVSLNNFLKLPCSCLDTGKALEKGKKDVVSVFWKAMFDLNCCFP